MLGSGWQVGSNRVRSRLWRVHWSWVVIVWLPVQNILILASNTLSLSTMMSTTQSISGQKLMTSQAVLSGPGLLAGGSLNLPVVLSCQSAQLCIREILQGQVVDGKAGVWRGGHHGGGGEVCLKRVDGVVRVGGVGRWLDKI